MEPDEAPLGNLDGSRWRSAVILIPNQGGASAWLSGSNCPETGARAIKPEVNSGEVFVPRVLAWQDLTLPLEGEMSAKLTERGKPQE